MSPGEATRALCISHATLKSWRQRGQIAWVPLGKWFFYPRADVERLIREQHAKKAAG